MATLFFLLSTIGFLVFIVLGFISFLKKNEKTKKNFIISGIFLVIMFISFAAVPVPENETAAEPQESEEPEVELELEESANQPNEKDEATKEIEDEVVDSEDSNEEILVKEEEKSPDTEIKTAVEQIIKEDLDNVTINQLMVNENAGLDDGSYIVLPHLVWNVKNGAKNTRDMLEMYSDHLAAKLADYNISEVTVFWEVPYHLEDNNVAKFNYQRQGDGMAIGDRWYAPMLRN